MNKTSIAKIKSATPFLVWFRRYLPQPLQVKIRPYLDRPYQLALGILDCCDSAQPRTVREIAQLSGVAHETARQVLQTLKEGGMAFSVSPRQGWQALQDRETYLPASTTHPEQDAQGITPDPVISTPYPAMFKAYD